MEWFLGVMLPFAPATAASAPLPASVDSFDHSSNGTFVNGQRLQGSGVA